MKIGILSRNNQLYSTRRLLEAAEVRGHEVRVIDTLRIAVELGIPKQVTSFHRPLPNVDAIVPRIGTSITFYGLAVVRQFEAQGILTLSSSKGIAHSRDKVHSLQLMSQNGLPIPRTVVAPVEADVRVLFNLVGGAPVVIKVVRGTQGRGVILARSVHTAEAVLAMLRARNEQLLLQEFIAEAKGRDLRLIVVGDRCVAAMQRTAASGDFRANLHRGGTAKRVELDEATQTLAVAATRLHGLGVAGVDLVQSARGPLVLEVNSSPGLEGIEQTTGVDVAGAMVDYLVELADKGE